LWIAEFSGGTVIACIPIRVPKWSINPICNPNPSPDLSVHVTLHWIWTEHIVQVSFRWVQIFFLFQNIYSSIHEHSINSSCMPSFLILHKQAHHWLALPKISMHIFTFTEILLFLTSLWLPYKIAGRVIALSNVDPTVREFTFVPSRKCMFCVYRWNKVRNETRHGEILR
jgi:hypothetical protein